MEETVDGLDEIVGGDFLDELFGFCTSLVVGGEEDLDD